MNRKRKARRSPNPANFKRTCINCGDIGPHYVPPSAHFPGFYACTKKD